jgi:hypothetical protein
VTTSHLSFFEVLGLPVSGAVDLFKSDFLDQLDSGATMDVAKPQCQNENGARSGGWSITSSTTNTVYWCFGMSGTTHVLKVTDDRRYPLEILHPALTITQPGSIDWGQLSSLSHLGSGNYTILAPGDSVTYAAAVPPGGKGGISTTFDGLGQSLMALQVGITTLVEILTRFGLAAGLSSATALGTALSDSGCADALGHGVGAILANCLDPSELTKVFGARGVLLAPVLAVSSLVAFFHSEFNALVDVVNDHDNYSVKISNSSSSPPVLGTLYRSEATGFGSAEPATVQYGGDGYSQATGVTWSSWGQSQATGTGTGWYVSADESQDQGSKAPITLVAFGLGTCGAGPAYTRLAWYFPSDGGSFDPNYYLNACTGMITLPPTPTPTTTTTTQSTGAAPCDVNQLATAATAYESANGDPDGSGSIISGYVCDGAYAATSYTPGNDPGTGAAMAFSWNGSAWMVLGEGNLVPPNVGIPSDVYSVLENGMANPTPANVGF